MQFKPNFQLDTYITTANPFWVIALYEPGIERKEPLLLNFPRLFFFPRFQSELGLPESCKGLLESGIGPPSPR